VPASFHYETPRQARLWRALHEAVSPAGQAGAAWGLYEQAAEAVVSRLPEGEVLVIGLGCGSGRKDCRVLEACRARGKRAHYLPVDVSLPLVLTAAEAAAPLVETGGGRIWPVVTDLMAEEDWGAWWQGEFPAGVACILTFYGMLPSLAPEEARACLQRWLRPGCWLMLSANLIPAGEGADALKGVLPQYDNDFTRRWLSVFLEDVGVPLSSGSLRFFCERYQGSPAVPAVVAEWQFHEPVEIRGEEGVVYYEAQERLRMLASYRYLPEQVEEVVQPLGQRVIASWVDRDAGEGVFLCAGG
jgi:hypothetical protein